MRTALTVLHLRERLIFRMAVLDGMPRRYLRRSNRQGSFDSVIVDQRSMAVQTSTPPKVAREGTLRGTVALSPGSITDLGLRKASVAESGLGWVNHQVLLRTNASLSRNANVDDKVSADQRGHGLGVSLGVYAISDLDQKIEAVTKLESAVIDGSDEDDFEFVGSVKGNPKAGSEKETE